MDDLSLVLLILNQLAWYARMHSNADVINIMALYRPKNAPTSLQH
jgi:hypothetical protein